MQRFRLRSAHLAIPALTLGAALFAGSAQAQTTVTLADTSQTTTLTATVAEQARVTFPSGVSFTVNNIAASTNSANASVNISNVVLATATKQLRVSLQSEAAAFTPPVSGAVTWSAGDVSWGAASWTNATSMPTQVFERFCALSVIAAHTCNPTTTSNPRRTPHSNVALLCRRCA